MTKAEARLYWRRTTYRRRGRAGYWVIEGNRWVKGLSFAQFWKTVQLQARLAASDPGGNIRL